MAELGTSPTMIVGIGASAGGLAAFETFLDHLPDLSGMAVVLVQHLDPDHPSLLVELLTPHSPMPIFQASDGTLVQSDCIYVIPPNTTLTIEDGFLKLASPATPRENRRPIDTFLFSLAKDQGKRAAAIILSGVGSDGAKGLTAVKDSDGLTLTQAGADKSALTGMPSSALATGKVDHLVAVEDMPAILIGRLAKLVSDQNWENGQASALDWPKHLAKITALLRAAIGHEFSDYKQNTLIRRVQRRMLALRIEDVNSYIAALEADAHEADLLFRDLLIGVTQFFRDPAAFEALQEVIVIKLLANRGADDPIRIWVPGCATGEEVYSLAILLQEAKQKANCDTETIVFGTDIDAAAISVARMGRYRQPIAGLSEKRLSRWFTGEGDVFKPIKSIRDTCVFSVHSLSKDPPFSKLDLISCRNVLIYMNKDLQNQVMQTFHYALKPHGILFLGPSESARQEPNMFKFIDRSHRLLERQSGAAGVPVRVSSPTKAAMESLEPRRIHANSDRIERSVRDVMERHSPVHFVVDRQFNIVRFSGPEAGRYLEPSTGTSSLGLFSMLRRALRSATRLALHTAMSEHREVIQPDPALNSGATEGEDVSIIVEPIEDGLFVVAIRDNSTHPSEDKNLIEDAKEDWDTDLGRELKSTRRQLKAAISELETHAEEQKSSTEELQSVNEELQSSNEELETAKEEMQSVNEELQTVNNELQSKNTTLERLNDDLANLLNSTQIATLFLDKNLCIRSFTPALADIFHVRKSDEGRPFDDITSRLDYAELVDDVRDILRTLAVVEREVRTKAGSGTTFLMRMRPYRTVDDRIDGVVVTFVDISEVKSAELARNEAELSFELVQGAASIGGWHWDLTTREMKLSEQAAGMIGYDPSHGPINRDWFRAHAHPDDVSSILEAFDAVEKGSADFEMEFRIVGGEDIRWLLGRGRVLKDGGDKPHRLMAVFLDITKLKRADETNRGLVQELDHRVKNMLALASTIAHRTAADAGTLDAFLETFTGRIESMARIHSHLSRGDWSGVRLKEVLADELAPYASPTNTHVEGDGVVLNASATQVLALAIHELTTNAAKYGALLAPGGKVSVSWQRRNAGTPEATLNFEWRETGGPKVVPPSRKGYGSSVIGDLIPYEIPGSTVEFDFPPEGVIRRISIPLDRIETQRA